MRKPTSNRVPLVTLVIAVGVAAAAVAGLASSKPTVPTDATRVTVAMAPAGRTIPSGFVGLSIEYPAITAYSGLDPNAVNPVFEQLIRNLAPGQRPSVRIGGDTTDWTWWPVPGMARPPGVTFTITDRWLAVARALTGALNARLILGINLEADSTALASAEANALISSLGSEHVDALELGNEPELYGSFAWYRTPGGHGVPGRPHGYSFADFVHDFTRFGQALPRRPLAGPAIGAPGVMRHLGQFLGSAPRLGLATLHRYPLQLCFTSPRSPRYPTVGNLLSIRASRGLAAGLAPYAARAHAHGLPLRIDEINTVSCGADPRVSQTFASALWALDAMFALARDGIDGVNLHTFPSAGYTLFTFSHRAGSWRASVRPEYYGLMMFAEAAPAGAQLLPVASRSASPVRLWATRAPDGAVRVVLINTTGTAHVLAVRIPGTAATATLARLEAPSAGSHTGVTLAHTSVDPATGALLPTTERVSPIGGDFVVRLPATTAALLTVR